MKFFGFKPAGESMNEMTKSLPVPDDFAAEGVTVQTEDWPKLFKKGKSVVPYSVDLDTKALADQYRTRIDEIFAIIKSKGSDSEGKIKVDKVTVKLGVDAGGSIGWFVEGRVDVSFAFEIEFKVSI